MIPPPPPAAIGMHGIPQEPARQPPQPRGFRLLCGSGAGLEHSQQSGDAQHRSRCVGGPPQSAVVRSLGEEIHRVGQRGCGMGARRRVAKVMHQHCGHQRRRRGRIEYLDPEAIGPGVRRRERSVANHGAGSGRGREIQGDRDAVGASGESSPPLNPLREYVVRALLGDDRIVQADLFTARCRIDLRVVRLELPRNAKRRLEETAEPPALPASTALFNALGRNDEHISGGRQIGQRDVVSALQQGR